MRLRPAAAGLPIWRRPQRRWSAGSEASKGVSGETIITSREEILKNFGRGRTQSFSRSFDAAKAERQQDIAAIQQEVSGEERPRHWMPTPPPR